MNFSNIVNHFLEFFVIISQYIKSKYTSKKAILIFLPTSVLRYSCNDSIRMNPVIERQKF